MKYSILPNSRRAAAAFLAGSLWLNGAAGPDAAWAEPVKASICARVDGDDADRDIPQTPSIDELPLTVWDLESAGDVHLAVFDFGVNPREVSISASLRLTTGFEGLDHLEADWGALPLEHVAVELQS